MKVLLAVLSCHFLRHYQQSIRDTWAKEVSEDVSLKFFLGNPQGSSSESDEVFLDVPDDFNNLTFKTVAIYKWALEQGYDFVFKCDLDCLVRVPLLLQSGFEAWDWMGGANSFFASGGGGYFLSRRAMEYVVAAGGVPGYEEDVHIAQVLLGNGLQLHNEPRFLFCPGDVMDDITITYHLSSIREWYYKGYKPEMMLEAWEDQKNRNYRAYLPGETLGQPEKRPIRFRRK